MSVLLFSRKPLLTRLNQAVRALFAYGEQGAWYDPSDLSTLFQGSAGTTPVTAVGQPVGLMLDKSGRGNHATQATAASRPVLSARVNLLTKTEQFDDAVWGKTAGSVSGTKLFVPNTASTIHRVNQSLVAASGVSYTVRGRVKGNGIRYVYVNTYANMTAQLGIDTTTGAYTSAGTGISNVLVTLAADGYCDFSYNGMGTGAAGNNIWFQANYTLAAADQTWAPNGTDGFYVDKVDVRPANSGIAPAYQRVNTATDYDTAGFPLFDSYNGTNSAMSAATGGGGSAGFFLCQAINPQGGAATARTLWSDTSTNTGYRVRINASNQLELAAGNGTAYTTAATTDTLPVGTTALVTAWDDGTNLNVQVNSGAVVSVARPVVSAGTAGFSLGTDNGTAANWFNGNLYPEVYRQGSGLTATQRAQVQTYCKAKAGL